MDGSVKYAFQASLASIAASLAIAAVVLPMTGGTPDLTALVMCVLCPLAIAFPISLRTHRQRMHMHRVNEELLAAHRQLAHAHAELAEKARLDPMTGLLNREAFFAAVRDARAEPEAGALLIIDADHFKNINDEHGHLAGDAALLKIAAAIRRGGRGRDIFGRIGGEEFAAFLPQVCELEASVVAEQIRRRVEEVAFPVQGGCLLPLTVSIGAVAAPRAAALSELMRLADRSLYEAKRRGRNRIVFADDNDESAAAA